MKKRKKLWWKVKKFVYAAEKDVALVMGISFILIILVTISANLNGDGSLPNIAIVEIQVDCEYCPDLTEVSNNIYSLGNVTSHQVLNVSEASNIIELYNITKLPTLILSGDGITIPIGFYRTNNVLIYDSVFPYMTEKGEIKGTVKLTEIIPDCEVCFNLDSFKQVLKEQLLITEEETLTVNEASELTEKYNIEILPTIILSEDALLYDLQTWYQIGTEETDALVLRKTNPPFYNLTSNTIEGLVDITYITVSCEDCYEVTAHKEILEKFNVGINSETFISKESASHLIEKYNIEKLPTVLLSEDASLYDQLVSAWKQVGSIEEDGIFVFRTVEIMQGNFVLS
jgi:hypothetical protein